MAKVDFNYYALYLKKYLIDNDDPRANDAEFINDRADLAGQEFENITSKICLTLKDVVIIHRFQGKTFLDGISLNSIMSSILNVTSSITACQLS